MILFGVLVCVLGAGSFVGAVWKDSGQAVAASVVVFLLGSALVLVGAHNRPPHDPRDYNSCPENTACMDE